MSAREALDDNDYAQALRLLHVLRAYSWLSAGTPTSARADPLYPPMRGKSRSDVEVWRAVDELLSKHPYGDPVAREPRALPGASNEANRQRVMQDLDHFTREAVDFLLTSDKVDEADAVTILVELIGAMQEKPPGETEEHPDSARLDYMEDALKTAGGIEFLRAADGDVQYSTEAAISLAVGNSIREVIDGAMRESDAETTPVTK